MLLELKKSLPKLSIMWQKNGQKTIPSSVEIANSKGCRLLVIEQMYCDFSNILLSSRVIPCQICMKILNPFKNVIFVSYHHN